MKKKTVKKEEITIVHLAELICANSFKMDKVAELVEQNSNDIKQNNNQLKELTVKVGQNTEKLNEHSEILLRHEAALYKNREDIRAMSIKFEAEIDELGTSTKLSFDKMEERFDIVDDRLDKIEHRLSTVEGARYHAHETRLDNIEGTLREIKTKLQIA